MKGASGSVADRPEFCLIPRNARFLIYVVSHVLCLKLIFLPLGQHKASNQVEG